MITGIGIVIRQIGYVITGIGIVITRIGHRDHAVVGPSSGTGGADR